MTIADCFVASALGVGNEETLANYRRGEAPGMVELDGLVASRRLFFGKVPAELPPVEAPELDIRCNRLLKLAVDGMPNLRSTIARCDPARVGIVLGASNTGVHEALALVEEWMDSASRPPRFDYSMLELGTPAAYLKRLLGVEGPAYVISTACSSATKAFGAARRLIACGKCDLVITGGVDGVCRFAANGFEALGALSASRCRPFAADRDGINLGEGVALFTMMAEGEGVRLAGVGESSDAYHATSPDPAGRGAEAAMRAALAYAAIGPTAVDYINLHGTGTLANDEMEGAAVRRVFGSLDRAESTKRLTGHCLGAAGAVEAAICWLKVRAGDCKVALSNSFAFGGANASVIFA